MQAMTTSMTQKAKTRNTMRLPLSPLHERDASHAQSTVRRQEVQEDAAGRTAIATSDNKHTGHGACMQCSRRTHAPKAMVRNT